MQNPPNPKQTPTKKFSDYAPNTDQYLNIQLVTDDFWCTIG